MARRKLSIDDKIDQQKLMVSSFLQVKFYSSFFLDVSVDAA